jgi:hypothetical protein
MVPHGRNVSSVWKKELKFKKQIYFKLFLFKKFTLRCQFIVKGGLVVFTSDPSYSGGRDQEDLGSRPTWAKRPHVDK